MIAVMLAAGIISAAPSPPDLIERPTWKIVPEASDVPRYYPDLAQRQGVEGWAAMLCRVAPEGQLTACVVEEEFPAELGFGQAVVRLGDLMRMGELDKDGVPTAGRPVRVKINFKLPR